MRLGGYHKTIWRFFILAYPNFRDVDGELFLVVNSPDGKEVLNERLNRGEAWRLLTQLVKYLSFNQL